MSSNENLTAVASLGHLASTRLQGSSSVSTDPSRRISIFRLTGRHSHTYILPFFRQRVLGFKLVHTDAGTRIDLEHLPSDKLACNPSRPHEPTYLLHEMTESFVQVPELARIDRQPPSVLGHETT